MWSDASSSSRGATTASTGMSVESFAEDDERIRTLYRNTISAQFSSLHEFVNDHMERAENSASADSLVRATALVGAPKTLVGHPIVTTAPPPAVTTTANQHQQPKVPRWKQFTSDIIDVFESLQRTPSGRHIPLSDLNLVAAMCIRTVTLLCLSAGAFSAFETAAPGQQSGGSKTAKVWFEITRARSKRWKTKVSQMKLLAHIARCIQDPGAMTASESDFPFCPSDAAQLLRTLSESEAKRELAAQGLDANKRLEDMMLFASSEEFKEEQQEQQEQEDKQQQQQVTQSAFAGTRRQRQDDGPNEPRSTTNANNNNKGSSHSNSVSNSPFRSPTINKLLTLGTPVPQAPLFKDQYGTTWSPRLRHGCAILGAVAQCVRGMQLHLQFDIARANDEFDLPPVALTPLPNEPGWISRFVREQEEKQQQQDSTDDQADPALWMHISKELKRFGIKERLIRKALLPPAPPPVAAAADVTRAPDQVVSRQQREHDDDFIVEAASSNGAIDGDKNKKKTHKSRRDGGKDDDEEADEEDEQEREHQERIRRETARKAQRGENLFDRIDDEGKAIFQAQQQQGQQVNEVAVPCALSKIVADRARARAEVHDSFQRIQQLVSELRGQISHFSQCAEASRVLEALTPVFLASAETDLAAVKRVSEILLVTLAIATVAPQMLVCMSPDEFRKRAGELFRVDDDSQ